METHFSPLCCEDFFIQEASVTSCSGWYLNYSKDRIRQTKVETDESVHLLQESFDALKLPNNSLTWLLSNGGAFVFEADLWHRCADSKPTSIHSSMHPWNRSASGKLDWKSPKLPTLADCFTSFDWQRSANWIETVMAGGDASQSYSSTGSTSRDPVDYYPTQSAVPRRR